MIWNGADEAASLTSDARYRLALQSTERNLAMTIIRTTTGTGVKNVPLVKDVPQEFEVTVPATEDHYTMMKVTVPNEASNSARVQIDCEGATKAGRAQHTELVKALTPGTHRFSVTALSRDVVVNVVYLHKPLSKMPPIPGWK